MEGGAFYNSDHLHALWEERGDRKKYRQAAYETKLKGLVRYLTGTNMRLLLRVKRTGA